MMGF